MGKSCMRFKKPEDIPYQLIGELASKITPNIGLKCMKMLLLRNKKRNSKKLRF
jgi:hypothetical protein